MINRVLVISRYNEDLNWLRDIKTWDYVIYNKGEDIEFDNIRLNNVGREAHTYLHYIVNNYDNLPDYVGFLQGCPFPHFNELYPYNIEDIIKSFNSFITDGFKFIKYFSNQEKISDRNGLPDHYLPNLSDYANTIGISISDSIPFTPGAQFVVSRDVIYRNSKDYYNNILQTVSNDICPVEAYLLERLWMLIFKRD